MRPTRYHWLIVALLFLVSTVSYLERVNVGAVGDLLMKELELDQARLGRLFSAFLLGYALFQYPAGLLADRFGPRRVLGGALLGWGVCTALTAAVGRPFLLPWLGVFPTLLAVRFLLGVLQAPTFPGAARSIASWVSPARRAAANAAVIAGIGAGSALTPPLLAYLAAAWGWRTALLLISLPSFVLAAVWLVAGRDAPPVTRPPDPAGRPEARGPVANVLRGKDLWLLTLSYALQGYVSYVFVFWFLQYLIQVRHFDRLEGSWLATMPWLFTLVTTPLGGLLSDRLVRRLGYPWGRRLWPMLALALAGALLCLGARAERPYAAVALLTACEALVMSVEGAFWASATEIARDHPGAAGGVLNMGGNLGGVLSPSVTPAVAAALGWVAALDVAAGLSVLGGLLWFWVSPTATAPGAPAPAAEGPGPELNEPPPK